MEAAENAGFIAHNLRFINYGRLYRNAISLVDISDESCMSIDSKDITQSDNDCCLGTPKETRCHKLSIRSSLKL
jgi:hypothetical protein